MDRHEEQIDIVLRAAWEANSRIKCGAKVLRNLKSRRQSTIKIWSHPSL